MILGLQNCPRCKKPASTFSLKDAQATALWIATCETKGCSRTFGPTEEAARAKWNRLRAPRFTLPGDELGAGITDAAARQTVLGRVQVAPTYYNELLGGFPWERIQRLLGELVDAGEVIHEKITVAGGGNIKRDAWRLAPEVSCSSFGADPSVNPAPKREWDSRGWSPEPPALPARADDAQLPRNGVPPMAKKKSVDPEQMPLIEVDHPATKKFKELRGKAQRLDAKAKGLNQEKKETRHAILELVRQEFKVKPDVDGVIKFALDGETVKITPGESKLSFTTEPLEPEEEDEEEGK